jgi:hypothetical protein
VHNGPPWLFSTQFLEGPFPETELLGSGVIGP